MFFLQFLTFNKISSTFFITKTLELNTTESSTLMIFSAVCYVALLFSHTFKIGEHYCTVKLMIFYHEAQTVNTVFRKLCYFTYLTLSSETCTSSRLLGICEHLLSCFQTFLIIFPTFIRLWVTHALSTT